MKRNLLLLTGAAFLILLAFGCRQAKPQKAEGKINVTSVTFPSYDFVRAIAGDRVNLVMLLPPGSESHSYEPRPLDILTIRESDIFIYPGGENSKWVDRILESMNLPEDKMTVLKLMDLVEVVEEELVEGMEDDNDEETIFDEHVWTSPRNAKTIVTAITDTLCEKDSVNGDFYRQNAADYSARLDELDASFRSIVEGAKRKTIIFGDRFPFRYLADAYGLSYFAAFPGCSTETEPSAATVAFLINKVRSEQVSVIFHIELSNERMADTISEATGAKKLLLHSCHNITRKEFESGVNYLDLQRVNVEHLREALR
ncbi:MAG: metal ABC transporter substrate-binding protein [Treponema sp.]|jgi:zinc transport system substrate-binding protein|nr:metal ABC transporter substrate-binding protein [Treponema sp.]